MALRRSAKLVFSLAMVSGMAALLAGCESPADQASGYKAFAPISQATLELMRAKNTDQNAPMLIRAYKKEAEFEIWKQKKDGKYALLKTFPMCRWSGQLGPKKTEGDRQVPEGFYNITPGQMNPNSHYYLSFNVGYPNAYDRAHGYVGGNIMVHGICSSAGCFSMTDKQIEEIYALARESFAGGQRAIQMQSYPFRMTADNMAKLRLDPNMTFWKEIKKGSDYFDVTKTETPVGVCNKHYVFGTPKTGRFDAFSPCPPLAQDPEVDQAVAAKEAADSREVADLVAKGAKPVQIVYADGGQNESFRSMRIAEVSQPDALAAGAREIALDDSPKGKPVAVQVASARAKALKTIKSPVAVAAATPSTPPAPATAAAPVQVAANTSVVPATFTAAPSAYASEQPKPEAASFFSKLTNFGGSAAPEAAPAIQAQTPTVVASAAPETSKATKAAPAKHAPAKPADKTAAAKPAAPITTPAPATKPEQLSAATPAQTSPSLSSKLLGYLSMN